MWLKNSLNFLKFFKFYILPGSLYIFKYHKPTHLNKVLKYPNLIKFRSLDRRNRYMYIFCKIDWESSYGLTTLDVFSTHPLFDNSIHLVIILQHFSLIIICYKKVSFDYRLFLIDLPCYSFWTLLYDFDAFWTCIY